MIWVQGETIGKWILPENLDLTHVGEGAWSVTEMLGWQVIQWGNGFLQHKKNTLYVSSTSTQEKSIALLEEI